MKYLVKTSILAIASACVAAPLGAQAADDSIVVTASRSGDAIPAHLLGSSVTVIDNEALESRQTRVLSDVLRDVPGVAVNRTGAIGGLTQIRIRGSEGNHVLVFIDGIKASDPFYGEYDFGNLLADEGARVEVLRGQQSSLYGSDAIGGVITYTTLSGREAPGISARAEGGSFGTFSSAGRAAGTLGDDADYAVSATYLTTDGYATAPGGRRNLGSENLGTSAKLNWTPAPNLKLTAVARYSYTNADLNDQGMDENSPIVRGYPVQVTIDTPGSYYRNKAFYGLVRAELGLFDDTVTTALSGQLTDANRDAFNADGYSYGNRGRRYRGSFENTFRFGTDAIKNRFTLAIDAEREEFRNIDPTGYAYGGQHQVDTIGVVTQYDVTIHDRLALGASVRLDDSNRYDPATTVRLSGSYLFDSGTRLHAAYGNATKAPSSGELFGYSDGQYIGNPDLAPERSRGWEAGVSQRLLGGAITIGATYFDNRFYDQIQTVGTMVGDNYVSTSINNDVVNDQHGVESYINARFDEWRIDASYTYLKAPQTISALANPAPADGSLQAAVPIETQAVRRPQHTASLNIGYAPTNMPIAATLTLRYNGRQRDYAFNSKWQRLLVDMKAFTLVNFNASYDLSDKVQLFGRVENILNTQYQEVFTFDAAGRSAYGGVRLSF